MKKIFILTGEPSGDKLAARVISQIKNLNLKIQYLSVGGEHLKKLNVETIYDLKEITYLGFTKVFLNLFKIKKKIKFTVNEIIKYNPDILFSVDSPDFTLRVAKQVKKFKPLIKTIHFVAPKVYVWRESRVKKLKTFLDQILLLFPFEKKYFDKENMNCTFVGHPLLETFQQDDTNLPILPNIKKKIISIFPGSRLSEVKILMPILINFIRLIEKKYDNFFFVFHSTNDLKHIVEDTLSLSYVKNYEIITDEKIKRNILSRTNFAIAKSGTISLEISNAQVPSIIIYKMNIINFFIIKLLVKTRYANILNIISNSEIIPELLQTNCNPNKIFSVFESFIENPHLQKEQLKNCKNIIDKMKIDIPATKKIANILKKEL